MGSLDFRPDLMGLIPDAWWSYAQAGVCVFVAWGCIWQLVHDGKFAVAHGWKVIPARVGLIFQAAAALGGFGDAASNGQAHPLFVLFAASTAMIQIYVIIGRVSVYMREAPPHRFPTKSREQKQNTLR